MYRGSGSSCITRSIRAEVTSKADHLFQLEASESKFVPTDQLPQVHHDWNEEKAQVVAYAASYAPTSVQ